MEYLEGRETMLILYKFSLFNINGSYIVNKLRYSCNFFRTVYV